ncbi:hypothetical protein KZZ52_15255 [Dactylosporangium sp. AC04546]|uniref:hypothetical protein n=1 Tax=Dactylosporangium sp. AC04546 TaxID=2862460 RepID=UPI001EDF6CEC|nr:hypothetical protein [Dactylosporangium sp. AC04546]WVK86664.1 hypothetical protein KZZ52_15255 [Dactylosporangium sp. AC04546]
MAEIVYDADTIGELATAFTKLKADVEDHGVKELAKVAVVAGDFFDADELEKLVTDRKTQLETNLKGLADALGIIGEKLAQVAKNATSTEAQNNLTAADLQGLIDGVTAKLPGIGGD